MSPGARLILTLLLIAISLLAGLACKRFFPAASLARFRKQVQSVAIYFLLPFSAAVSLWGFPSPEGMLLFLPLLGLVGYTSGSVLAWCAARLLRLSRAATGSFICCGAISNIGAVGALISLVFFGENSIAVVALYRLFEDVFYFTVLIPLSRHFSDHRQSPGPKRRFDPLLPAIIAALALGMILNFTGVARPGFLGPCASVAMYVATTSFIFSIGTSLKVTSIRNDIKPALCMCAIKFIALPAIVCSCAWAAGFGTFDNGFVFAIVAIISSMPVGMTALAPPTLFDLDVDLANTCWMITTLGLLALVPCLMVGLLAYL